MAFRQAVLVEVVAAGVAFFVLGMACKNPFENPSVF